MKFFVSVFLLILGPFSVIKTVLGLGCYVVNTTTECQSERKEPNESDERSSHQAFSKYFACVRQRMTLMQRGKHCESESAECATLTYELKDKTQLLIKSCEKSDHSICNALQRMNDEEYKFSNFVINSSCDFCSSETCNNKIANDNPLLPTLSTTEVTSLPPTEESSTPPEGSSAPPSLSCHNNNINLEYLPNCVKKATDAENRDHYIRRVIDCFRESTSNENNEECPEEGTECTTLVYEINDQPEFMVKSCDNSTHFICNTLKNVFDKMLSPLKKFVNKRSYCESCSSDYCNNKPPPRGNQEKLYGSPSAISTFIPSATAVFVTVFIIHLLLWI